MVFFASHRVKKCYAISFKHTPSLNRNARKPFWVQEQILRLAALLPKGTGVRAIAIHYNRLHVQQAKAHLRTVSKSYVANLLREHRAELAKLRQRFKTSVPKPMLKNRIWGVDLTGKVDINGKLHQIFGVIDHGTRRLLNIQVLPTKTAEQLSTQILQTAARYGLPKFVRTDNEANFKSKRFRRHFKRLGIKHQTTDLGCPWQNGRIERLWGTLKEHLNQIHVQSAEDLQHKLSEFAVWYNDIRPHQHLSGQTPAEAWKNIDPYDKTKVPKSIHHWVGWDGMLSGLQFRW